MSKKPSKQRTATLTTEELQDIVKIGVHQALTILGVDVGSPDDMQRDFQFLRDRRKTCEKVRNAGMYAAVTTSVTAALGLAWAGFKALIAIKTGEPPGP